jgi:hypothetical protein
MCSKSKVEKDQHFYNTHRNFIMVNLMNNFKEIKHKFFIQLKTRPLKKNTQRRRDAKTPQSFYNIPLRYLRALAALRDILFCPLKY